MARIPFPDREPCFFNGDDDVVQFQFVIDERNVIGPRPATPADKMAHPKVWAEFEAAIVRPSASYDYEKQGTAYDPHAAGYELQGRDSNPLPTPGAPKTKRPYKRRTAK